MASEISLQVKELLWRLLLLLLKEGALMAIYSLCFIGGGKDCLLVHGVMGRRDLGSHVLLRPKYISDLILEHRVIVRLKEDLMIREFRLRKEESRVSLHLHRLILLFHHGSFTRKPCRPIALPLP
jgi:hypothetical protein